MNEQMKLAEEKMQKTLHVLSGDYAAIRAGRANPGVLDKIVVDYYGVPDPGSRRWLRSQLRKPVCL